MVWDPDAEPWNSNSPADSILWFTIRFYDQPVPFALSRPNEGLVAACSFGLSSILLLQCHAEGPQTPHPINVN